MNQQRSAYLRALGIQEWVARKPANTGPGPIEKKVVHPGNSALSGWDDLEQRVAVCEHCKLSCQRTHTVLGSGAHDARWLLVGEAPGAEEDRQGKPFVGRAGKLLNNMLAAMGLQRENVYITNTVKCRPPNNRNPEAEEIEACRLYLETQITLLRPALILVLGRIAAHALLEVHTPLGALRGAKHVYRQGNLEVPLIVTYHPAYLLRRPEDKSKAWVDWLLARSIVEANV